MDCLSILAQAAGNGAAEASGNVIDVNSLWTYINGLDYIEALTFVSFGAVCLFYGWRVFKILVVITFGLLGLIIGMVLTSRLVGTDNQLVGGLIGMGLLASLSVPLMRWAVSVLGALAGAVLTGGIWYAVGLNESFMWAGALTGLVAGGMISFIVFRVAIILFTSLGGSALAMSGILAILNRYPQTSDPIWTLVSTRKWFLPLVLLVPTFVGIIAQHKFVKGSKEWDI